MLKKTLTYTDFNGQTHTEDFYFNLSKAELAEWEMRENMAGGLGARLQTIINSGDGRQIMDTFKEIISKAYGVKSSDGRSFVKGEDISREFMGSGAYEELFMELITSPTAASDFINAVVPSNLEQTAREMAERQRQARFQPQDHLQKRTVEKELPTERQDPADRYRTLIPDSPAPEEMPLPVPTEEELAAWRAANPQYLTRPPHESGPQG